MHQFEHDAAEITLGERTAGSPEEGRAEMDGALAEGGEGAGASPPGPATGEPRARAAPRPEPGAR